MSSRSGWKIAGYSAVRLIGYGAAGQVWLGRTVRTGLPVALKRIDATDPSQRRAAEAEAALLSALEHPNLIRLHELVPDGPALVLVLDLAEGGSLADLLDRRGRLAPGEVVTALAPIAAALAYAHDEGVTHSDVSPANVLFTDQGVPLLADLGTARLLGGTGLPHATLAYLDPSVAAGGAPAAPSDVFALAGVALHALSGRPPWSGTTPEEILAQAGTGEIADLDDRLRDVPIDLARVVRRGLAAEPYARGSAAEFALDLRHAVHPVPVELSAGLAPTDPAQPEEQDPVATSVPASAPDNRPPVRLGGQEVVDRPGFDRPGFDRPGFDRPGFDRPGRRDDAASEAAPPMTHAVRARPRPPLPPATRSAELVRTLRSLDSRRVLMVATAAVVLIAVAAVVWWPRGSSSAPPVAVMSVARSTVASVGPTPTARPKAPTPTPTWSEVLTALDAQREQAYATRNPGLLAGVYVDGPLLRQDVITLARQVPAGCQVIGLRTSYADVALESRANGVISLRVTATLAAGALTCASIVTSHTAARPATPLTIGLVPHGAGYRISRLTA